MKKSAQVLETHDLREAIRRTRNRILDDTRLFDVSVLAKYGLVLCYELCGRINCESPVKQKFWISRLKGSPEWPEFMESYYGNHRALLVLFGWMRLLIKQGYEQQDLIGIVRDTLNPQELEDQFTEMAEPGERTYSHFTELPGAYMLWPKLYH